MVKKTATRMVRGFTEYVSIREASRMLSVSRRQVPHLFKYHYLGGRPWIRLADVELFQARKLDTPISAYVLYSGVGNPWIYFEESGLLHHLKRLEIGKPWQITRVNLSVEDTEKILS